MKKILLAASLFGVLGLTSCKKDEVTTTSTTVKSSQDTTANTGSALNLSGVDNILKKIWGPGSNGIVIGGGLNYSTQDGVGWSQKYGSIYCTSYSIQGVGSNFLTTDTSKIVKITSEVGSIVEVWDLETLKVIATNIGNPGSNLLFTAIANHRYGGFAWYADNAQKSLGIFASYN